MKKKNLLAALLLMLAGVQTAVAQGFRVYQSDGTELQFSLKTDSIVFDNGLSGDEVFGPFTPVNLCIAKTWYKTKYETVTFNEDGTTDYMEGATYKFFPYQGNIVFYNASGAPMNVLKVYEVTAEKMIVGSPDGSNLSVWSSTKPSQLVTSITLSETSITLQPDGTKRLTATVYPSDADNRAVEWASSNSGVAQVINGLVVAVAKGGCTITCSATDGSGVKAECQVTVTSGTTPDPGDHAWVDLGLPSKTLWATCNIGAEKPEDYGDYFAWGETEPKTTYTWSTYKWMNAGQSSWSQINKYTFADGKTSACWYDGNGNFIGDGKTELDPTDDAATANWGSGWQMPSLDQIEELYNSEYTTTEWTQLNGVNGRKITSKSNGNSIFLPAAGYRYGTNFSYADSDGYYWSRSLDTSGFSNYAYDLYFTSGRIYWSYFYRYLGQSVRPVRVQ